jgi:hypothetical protein
MIKKSKKIVPLEETEQKIVVQYLRSAHPQALYCASAGGMRTSMRQAIKMKQMGYIAGFPDLFIYEQRKGFGGLAIEMKRVSGGVASPEQKQWKAHLLMNGYAAYICKGAEEAIKVIDEYFK